MCADVVIAVDISTPLEDPEKVRSVLAITGQLIGFLTRRNTEVQIASLTDRDILLVPDLGEIGTGDFKEAGAAIPTGVVAADKARPKLAVLSLDESSYARHRSEHPAEAGSRPPPTVDFVRIENASALGEEVIDRYIHREDDQIVGRPLDIETVERKIGRLYGLELFESIRYDIVEENGQTGLVVHVRERSWGPNYLQGGLAISSDFNGDSIFNLGFAYTRTLINELNGEFRIVGQIGEDPLFGAEIYQPLDPGLRWFVKGGVKAGSFNQNLWDGSDRVAEDRIREYGTSFSVGRNIGDWVNAEVGVERYWGEADLRIGDQQRFDDFDFDLGLARATLVVDSLDNVNFPRSGMLAVADWSSSLESLGADDEYDQVQAAFGAPITWGRNTIIPGIRYQGTIDDDAPVAALFRGGGFLRLSGFQADELSGQHFGTVSAIYLRQINDFNLLQTYLGASLEAGNTWQDSDDVFDDTLLAGSVFIGVDTPLGPLYLALGVAEDGNESLYLSLGKPLLSREN
jgi:NTE family protein